MPRSSRKDRRVQRERAQRASDRGLPAAAPEAYRPARRGQVTRGAEDSPLLVHSSEAPQPAARARGWLSQWPLSMKVLGLATLLLLAIGLWRTLTSQTGP